MGYVINDIDFTSNYYTYGYRYMYNYGYSYGYAADSKKKLPWYKKITSLLRGNKK